mmetsp:Transcript_106830/g.189857  ORF Transcript_106830/g.189857 Transcript_106830/m.189857 type:complete len:104 (-) Transcript_106830:421-732(-)
MLSFASNASSIEMPPAHRMKRERCSAEVGGSMQAAAQAIAVAEEQPDIGDSTPVRPQRVRRNSHECVVFSDSTPLSECSDAGNAKAAFFPGHGPGSGSAARRA